ncbi:hypothetical protein MTO96_012956 [Rhipicephalus appendiculatus]
MTSLSTNHAFCLERDEDSGDLDVNLNGPIGPMLEQPDGDNNLLSEKEVDEAEQQDLPEGWERHLDDDGPLLLAHPHWDHPT